MAANSVSLATNLNIFPYYDDFDETKNFYRILYKPGFAVQARELTQTQTMLQNQIDRFAEHIFQEGSVVRGCEMNYDRNISYIKVRDDDQNGNPVDASAFVGSKITGQLSGVTAIVYDALTGSESNAPNTKTLYVKYTNSGSNNTTRSLLSGEVLVSNTSLQANVVTEGVQASDVVGTASRITFGEGIIFTKDHFVYVPAQSLVLGRYSANASLKVGYDVTETIVTSASDQTLTDPAQGSYNYAAPGADRLKLTATLVTKSLTATDTENFIERVRLKNGNVEEKFDKPLYSIINDYLARRTYDESGDYLVNGLSVRMREHLKSGDNQGVYTAANGGDANKVSVDIAPGRAYVQGYGTELLVTQHVPVDKGNDFDSIEGQTVSANYGNYTLVSETVGSWDVNGHDRVSLYDTAMNAISNATYSSTAPVGNKIGEARVRAIEYDSGVKGGADGKYRLFIYDVDMTANNFSNVRSIYYNDGSKDGFADTVLSSNNAQLFETSFNRALFRIPAENIRTLRDTTGNIDTNFRFLKKFDVTIASDGTFTLNTGSADEQFPFSTGLLNNTQERDNFHLVLDGSANSAVAVDTTASRTAGGNTVTGLTDATTKYNVGDIVYLTGDANTHVISSINSATEVEIIGPAANTGPALSGVDIFKQFRPGQVISLNGYGSDNSDRNVTINSSTSAAFDIKESLTNGVSASIICELNKIDGQEKAKVLQPNRYVQLFTANNTNGTTGPWNLGLSDGYALKEVRVKSGGSAFSSLTEGADVTNQFTLDPGMKDNLYDHAKLVLKNSATHTVANGNVYLVKMDYFTHDTSQGVGYFSVDSYPIDDVDAANTNAITTGEIPVYASKITGERYDLRNYIDIRPRIADTATNTTSLSGITSNPETSVDVVEPTGGLHYISPNDSLTADLDYYLPRKDRIIITSKGTVRAIRGTPSLTPQTPPPASDGLTLAIVDIKPFPSLPYESAKRIGRTDLANSITPVRQKRYTMRDIGTIASRVDNLEYYASLSLLESDTKNLVISDAAGNDRFKNGILVDQFTGHNIGNVFNEDYNIAIDPQNNELRPTFKLDDVKLKFDSSSSSGVSIKSKDARLTLGSSSATFTVGESVTSGGASGTVAYQVGQRLYLENVSGTFTTSANAVGGSSSSISTITAVSTPANSSLITLPYTHEELIDQPYAATTRNAAGLFWSFKGSIGLNPATDYWVDTTTLPEVQVDIDLNTQAWQNLANAWGTQWGDWNTIWSGTSSSSIRINNGTQTTTTTTSGQVREGLEASATTSSSSQSIGESVRDVSIIPFMRSREIQFTAVGMKPSTKLFAFFDDEDVSAYCTPANSSFANTASEGSSIITNADGNAYGIFRLPNEDALRFRSGTLTFKLTDSNVGGTDGESTTFATAQYTASGLSQTVQDTIISTRAVELEFNSVTESRTVSSSSTSFQADPAPRGGDNGNDPVAQTFLIDTSATSYPSTPGVYLSKLDLYFQSKDSTVPVQIEIREVDPATSFITKNIVPFGVKLLYPDDVNISDDASAVTPVIFDTPVYLLNGTEYAVVIKPLATNPNYTVWASRLGEDDITTGNRIVSQPLSGVLFASANDRTWTEYQNEDLKFKAYIANFGTNSNGTAVLNNEDREYFTIANTTGTFNSIGEIVNGETTLTLNTSISANVGDTLVGSTSSANGEITFKSGSTIRLKDVTIDSKFANSETVTVYTGGVATGTTGSISIQSTPNGKVIFYDNTTQANTFLHLSAPSGTFVTNTWIKGQKNGSQARINSIDNLSVDTFHTHLSKLELQDTTSTITGKLAITPTSLDSSFRRVNDNNDTEYSNRRYILSKSNETSNLSGNKSGQFRLALTNGSNPSHSPAIDVDRAALFTVENIVNNDSTGEDAASGGNAIARYITRTVTLADGQDAEDMKMYLTAYKPSTSSVLVYYKILNGEDGSTFEDQPWRPMDQVTSSTVVSDYEDKADFKEYEFSIPDTDLTGPNDEVQYTTSSGVTFTGYKYFALKIVLLSTTPSRVPRCRDLRAIALQV